MGLWYWITEEFKALGLRCVAYGPEFWLTVAAISWVIAVAIAVVYAICLFAIWRDK